MTMMIGMTPFSSPSTSKRASVQNNKRILMIISKMSTLSSRHLLASLLLLLTMTRMTHGFVAISRKNNINENGSHHIIKEGTSTISLPPLSSLSSSTSCTALFCQLLALNSATPTEFAKELKGFCKRGGETDIHSDGWGLAYYDDNDNGNNKSNHHQQHHHHQQQQQQLQQLKLYHDVQAASCCPMAELLTAYPIKTHNMLAHVRYATVGTVEPNNVHPFTRQLFGVQWCFAHNGEVPVFHNENNNKNNIINYYKNFLNNDQQRFQPVGTTDSEATFCAILNELHFKFGNDYTDTLPPLPVLHETIQSILTDIISKDDLTILNFVMSCGPRLLWAYSCPGSRPGSKVWNGLHYTMRTFPHSLFKSSSTMKSQLQETQDYTMRTSIHDCVSVIATEPLTDHEKWVEFERGQLILFDQGRPYMTPAELHQVVLDGYQHATTRPLEPLILEPHHFVAAGI